MPIFDNLEKLDRASERHRSRYGSPSISPRMEEAAKDAYHRIAMISLLPPKVRPKLDFFFSEAETKFGVGSKILTRPHLTALFVEGLIGYPVARQAKMSYEQQIADPKNRSLHRERFLALASVRRGIKDAMQFVIHSELSVLYKGAVEEFGYIESIKASRMGEAKTGEDQANIEQAVIEEIEDLRLLRAGDPSAERALSYFSVFYPERENKEGLIMPLAILGVEQAQMLYSDLFPGTIRYLPDEIIV